MTLGVNISWAPTLIQRTAKLE